MTDDPRVEAVSVALVKAGLSWEISVAAVEWLRATARALIAAADAADAVDPLRQAKQPPQAPPSPAQAGGEVGVGDG